MKKIRKNYGITLISLVVTIIVLIILAGVSIAMLVGENGILSKASEAKKETQKAEIIEQIQLDITNKQIEGKGILTEDDFYMIIEKYGYISNYNTTLTTFKGNYEISLNELYAGELQTKLVTTPLSSWRFVLSGTTDIVLKQYIGTDDKIFVPNTFIWDGVEYNTIIGNTNGSGNSWDGPFAMNKNIKEIKFGDKVQGQLPLAYALFFGCTNLEKVYNLPNNYTELRYTFGLCTSLRKIPTIGKNVTRMSGCFDSCYSLSGNIYIEADNINNVEYCFNDTKNSIILNVKKDTITYNSFYEKMSDWPNVQFSDNLNNQIENMNIACWGDSLTAGAGGNGTTYPEILQQLIGNSVTVTNLGVGGENSSNIAMRQGGISIYVNAFTIPASTDRVEINITSENNSYIAFAQQGTSGLNPCYINDIEGNITYDSSTRKYYFARTSIGNEISVNANTQVITNGMKSNKGDILVIWAGTNDTNIENTIMNIDEMLKYNDSNKYIIIGLTYKNNVLNVNQTLQDRYGEHFLDIRKYILQNGLSDAGITATEQDEIDINNGEIPSSLRYDNVHLNAEGYTIVGEQVYNKLISLGYIEE